MRKATMTVLFSIGLLTPAFADPAMAPVTSPDTQNLSEAAFHAQSNEPVCHYIYHEGAVLSHRECLTQREWTNRRLQLQQDLREYQNLSLYHR